MGYMGALNSFLLLFLCPKTNLTMSSDHQANERCMYCEGQIRPLVKEVSTQKPEAI